MYKYIKFNHAITLQKFLKKKLKKGQKVFRYIFHKNKNDKDQLMMIWQKKNYYFMPKKFTTSQQIYFLNKGRLNIYIFDAGGKLLQTHKLSKDNPVCKVKKMFIMQMLQRVLMQFIAKLQLTHSKIEKLYL